MSDFVFVEENPSPGKVVPVQAGATIGREGCHITLDDPEVSRRHAVMDLWEGQPTIEDLGSLNGTWVNGVRVEQRTLLEDGTTVRFGQTTWRVTHQPQAQAAQPHADQGPQQQPADEYQDYTR